MTAHALHTQNMHPKINTMPNAYSTLKNLLETQKEAIETWFEAQYLNTPHLFYSSVDLRRSNTKLVPVDTNLFPAGFNLLTEEAYKRGAEEVKDFIDHSARGAKNILLIPENHTRNTYYLQNVYALKNILTQSGLNVIVGSLALETAENFETSSGNTLELTPITRQGNTLVCGGMPIDMVIVNNDLSSGLPEILERLEQPIFPPVELGWFRRRKTGHFDSYADIAHRFATRFNFDPWLISAIYTKCGNINFKEMTGLECVALNVERALLRIQAKYDEYGIMEKPYLFIKADSGTYGMGIMTVHSAEEVLELNKKDRNKMNMIKEGATNSEVIIQEGVPTIDLVEGNPAEPMIYLMNSQPIACLYRANTERDQYGNLNAKGMLFSQISDSSQTIGQVLCPMQALIARLASLAAARECYEPVWEI